MPNLLRKDFTLCHAWWRTPEHTPLIHLLYHGKVTNHTYIKSLMKILEYYMLKYNRGIDQFLYENIEYKTYDKVCYSIRGKEYDEEDKNYNICLFNQRKISNGRWLVWLVEKVFYTFNFLTALITSNGVCVFLIIDFVSVSLLFFTKSFSNINNFKIK